MEWFGLTVFPKCGFGIFVYKFFTSILELKEEKYEKIEQLATTCTWFWQRKRKEKKKKTLTKSKPLEMKIFIEP